MKYFKCDNCDVAGLRLEPSCIASCTEQPKKCLIEPALAIDFQEITKEEFFKECE